MPVTEFEVRSRTPLDGGRAFGDTGAYERIDGVLRYAVDPANESNLGIVDLDKAARDAQGRVVFEGDVSLLQPVDASKANGRLLADVVNRGNRTFMRYNLAVADALNRDNIALGDGYLMEQGWTIASIGWQWDVSRTEGRLGLEAPQALDSDGKPIRGWAYVSHQPQVLETHFMLSDRGHTPYPVADINQEDARLIVRDDPNGTRQEVPRAQWRFARVEAGNELPSNVHITMDRPHFEAGRWYDVIYTTDICPVVGSGLLAFRDAASFFRFSDAESNPARGRISHTFALGISQSGRFLREFLKAGANLDEEGRQVFDGLHLHIAGGRRGEFNHRYAQPSVIEPYGMGHLPPFAYEDTTHPHTGETLPGLLTRLRERGGVPKIIATNSGTEYWRGDASVMHVDPNGAKDLPDPAEARGYFFAGTQHGSGTLPLRQSTPDNNPATSNFINVTNYMPLLRAQLANLEAWVCDGVEPPPSALPRIADKTAVTRERVAYDYLGFSTINQTLSRRMFALPGLDFGPDAEAGVGKYPPVVSLAKMFPTLVSAVDQDGNDVAGIRLPDIAVPLATHTGWNPRHPDTFGIDQTVGLLGSTVPFAKTAEERERSGDPRLSIAERYRDKDDYLARCRPVAEQLVADRLLLPRDLEVVIQNAAERWDAIAGA